ncbi:MAG: NAD-dependent epimerase/dehydratase family protein [Candidatus Aminicenantes bacterium]|nr:NAD-dependent epimerase/dehydratase family protein [Candidatus Aminicenantes bacterium]
MKLRIFVTGATGFVGSHFLNNLKDPEWEIYGICFPDEPRFEQVSLKCQVKRTDIRCEKDIEDLIGSSQPDYVFHFAAISNVGQSWKKRKETFEVNVTGTFFLLEAVRKQAPQARVLFVSSSEVYGLLHSKFHPLIESDSVNPVSPYAFSKLSGENLCRFYHQIEDLDIVIARSFPHTGPGQSPDFVCSDWASQIARMEAGLSPPLIKVGNVKVKRDFVDVRDVVRAYDSLLKKGKKGELYNICSGEAISLNRILDILLEAARVKIDVEADEARIRKFDIPVLVGDNQKIKNEISWAPEIPIEQSVLDLLQYWRDVYHS